MTQRRAFTNMVYIAFLRPLCGFWSRSGEEERTNQPTILLPHTPQIDCDPRRCRVGMIIVIAISNLLRHHNSHCRFTQAWVRDPLPVDSVGLPVFIFSYARDTAGNIHHIYHHINQKNSILYNKSEQRHSAFAIHIIMWAWYYGYIISNQVTSVFQRVLHK